MIRLALLVMIVAVPLYATHDSLHGLSGEMPQENDSMCVLFTLVLNLLPVVMTKLKLYPHSRQTGPSGQICWSQP